jgi:hypothetical protein
VEDANVVKPTVTTGSKSGTPATEPGVGDGIGLDATQGAAKPETPAATGLGAAVSDTSTDNVPEGSQSAALRALIEEMRAATSGDINAAIPKSLAKRALDAGLIKKEDMGMALIARVAMKDAVDAYDAQAAAKLEGSQSAALLTPAAEELLAAAVLGAPSSITNNMRRIATENGIEILPTDTPTMVIDKLKAKKQAVESLTAASLAEEEFDFNARFDESLTAARLAEEEFDFNAGLDAARLAEEEFDFDEGFAGLDAARRAEKVAVDLDAKVAAQAAAELKDAQLPSIDEGLPETPVSTSEEARVQRTATKAKIEENQAEREATRLAQNQQAAQQAEALRTENAAQYRQGDLPLSRVPAEYDPRLGI